MQPGSTKHQGSLWKVNLLDYEKLYFEKYLRFSVLVRCRARQRIKPQCKTNKMV